MKVGRQAAIGRDASEDLHARESPTGSPSVVGGSSFTGCARIGRGHGQLADFGFDGGGDPIKELEAAAEQGAAMRMEVDKARADNHAGGVDDVSSRQRGWRESGDSSRLNSHIEFFFRT